MKTLSIAAIESSLEIDVWLSQFSTEEKRTIAKTMLCRLNFISRDLYSEWFGNAIADLPVSNTYAIYSVRKIEENEGILWNNDGSILPRPGTTLGSEDLVYSLISNLVRTDSEKFLDHPSLSVLLDKKVHEFVLIDDSIGSGDRVSEFINKMLKHPTFLSWWSFGFIKINILSFARTRESEYRIIAKIHGSDHAIRKYRKSSKLNFISKKVYSKHWLESRWGEKYLDVMEFCNRQTKIPTKCRCGYGKVMANIVFYHSVPNNIPGIFWCNNYRWNGLFPNRSIPNWLFELLDESNTGKSIGNNATSDILKLLELVRHGVRSPITIALRLSCDHQFAISLLTRAQKLRLLSEHNRLTSTGFDLLKRTMISPAVPIWNRNVYIPNSWCIAQATIQPPVSESLFFPELVDSVDVSASAEGDVGEASLERSDAKTVTPSFSIMPQIPPESRMSHDADGPSDLKER